jgi:hypothetical protein
VPYACWLVEPAESMRELANMKIARAMRTVGRVPEVRPLALLSHDRPAGDAPNWAMIEEESHA